MHSLREVYYSVIAKLPDAQIPCCRTFVKWNSFGCKFASLAEGGMVYLLLIIVGLDLCWSVAKASHRRVLWEVAKLLRAPDDSFSGYLIQSNIIPSVAYLRARLPISLPDLPTKVDCSDLGASDAYFGCVKGK
ncbi:hypothetical protein AZE42_12752 [Rhizopogon vesiculosus]|uniref:Uncharacterized protein n=1 Tax=Rhizopogon vesiculosus TaxID=180088 RepID=A0A1J8QL71_9AGAM|nr:hypothetical protein AZE42_12752 [Rhizopogon vesiculosus]